MLLQFVRVFPQVVQLVFAGLVIDVKVVVRTEGLEPGPAPLLARLGARGRGPPPVARQRVARKQRRHRALGDKGGVWHPAALRDGLDDEALAPVSQGRGVVREQRHERAPVHKGRRLGPGKVGEGRREVVVEHHVMQGLAFRHAGTAYDERYPDVLLVGRPLSGAQPVLAQVEAVVRGEDYVGVIQLAAGVQRS